MWLLTIKFLKALAGKLLPVLLILVLVVAGAALYLFLRDSVDLEANRARQIEALALEEARFRELREEASARLRQVEEQYAFAQGRYQQAQRLIKNLDALQSFWENLFRSRADREEQQNRLIWARQKEKEIAWSIEDIEGQIRATLAGLQRIDERLAEVERERAALVAAESEFLNYTHSGWVMVRQPLLLGIGAYLFGPSLWKLFCYYLWAPLLGLGRPIRLRETAGRLPRADPSQVSQRVWLNPGEKAILKERFLQASDDALRRRTRFVLDWRIPFSSAACGLIEMTEMRNETDGERFSVTFSTQEDPTLELSQIELEEGSSLVLRPSFLAGVVVREGERLRISRHWRFFSIPAWVTLQFRFFEFHGPCRLVVNGRRGVRAETMAAAAGSPVPARRTNRASTIGFTPDLQYEPVRAETFWAYYRDRNPLFDDLFRGPAGTFLCQEITTRDRSEGVGRFWSNFWGGMLKVFGL